MEDEVRSIKEDFGTTYMVIYELLSGGISLDGIVEILQIHRSRDFSPSIRSLKKLFCRLNYDIYDFNKSIELMKTYRYYLETLLQEDEENSRICYLYYTDKFKSSTRICYLFIQLLRLHSNSSEFVEYYLEKESDYYWDTDDNES